MLSTVSAGSAVSWALLEDSVVAVELDRRVFWSAGIRASSLEALSAGEVNGEMLATRWAAGMRLRKLLVGLDILAVRV